MGSMVTVSGRALVDADVQRRATEVLEREGLTVDEALRQMLMRTANDGVLPFSQEEPGHDAWFRAEVQAAMEDETPGISEEEVEQDWAKQRAELVSRAR